jgi:hypothetical protein
MQLCGIFIQLDLQGRGIGVAVSVQDRLTRNAIDQRLDRLGVAPVGEAERQLPAGRRRGPLAERLKPRPQAPTLQVWRPQCQSR